MTDFTGIACVIVPVLAMAIAIVLMLYSVGELRLMVDRLVGKIWDNLG